MNGDKAFIYARAASREGVRLIMLASLCTTAHAAVTINSPATVADLPPSPGALFIGNNGTGSLLIASGETVAAGQDISQGSGSVLGFSGGDSGAATVNGGVWYDSVSTANLPTGSGTTAIGGGGSGTLDILNGGKVYVMFINIAQNDNSSGTVNVDGANSGLFSTADTSSGITVGNGGNAVLNVSNGGKVTSNSGSHVGNLSGSTSTLNVSGAGSSYIVTAGPLSVGGQGNGTLNVTSSGTVNTVGGGIATESGGIGTATIAGAGSVWNIGTTSNLGVGYDSGDPAETIGTGTLILQDQGKVVARGIDVVSGTSVVAIGAAPGSAAAAPGILAGTRVRLLVAGASLIFNHTDTSGNYLFSPVVSGPGTLKNLSGTTVLTGVNTYTGGTTISGGTLQLGNGTTTGSIVGNILNDSIFIINNPTNISLKGVISGSGTLTLQGAGVTTLSAVNTYTGTFTLSAGTLRTAVVDSIASSNEVIVNGGVFDLNGNNQLVHRLGGTGGEIHLNGVTLTVNNPTTADNTTFAGDIVDGSAAGGLTKSGDGTLTLSGKTTWTGDTHIGGGELVLDGSNGGAQLVSNVIGQDNTALSLLNGAVLTGWIDPTGVSISSSSSWNMTADSLVDNMNLAGTLNFATPSTLPMSSGLTLTTTNWNGQGGTVVLNTSLGDDASVTDKIVVNGNTSGNTFMKVNNAGGSGAYTLNGIRVVEVKGQSDGTFTQSGRIIAGAFDYLLEKKGSDWFLTNLYVPPVTPETPAAPGVAPASGTPLIRPESASYTANLAAANTMFILTRLHDRLGEPQYTDALSGEKKVTSMWLRQEGGHNRWRDSSGAIHTLSNRYVVQLGGDIAQWSPDELQRWHLGLMGGYGHNNSNSRSHITGYRADGTVSGYSAGLYATWYQNDKTKQGIYVDSWTQYGWFNNDVKGEGLPNESYQSDGVTASLESGYTHKLGEFTGSLSSLSWYIQPQAQVIWMGVKADDHRENNGTHIIGEGDNNFLTRLGVRTFLKGNNKVDDGKNRTFQPFVEINWIHNTEKYGVRMNDLSLSQAGARDLGEIKTGVEGQLNPNLNLWGNVAVQVGNKGYSDTSAMVGVKYSF